MKLSVFVALALGASYVANGQFLRKNQAEVEQTNEIEVPPPLNPEEENNEVEIPSPFNPNEEHEVEVPPPFNPEEEEQGTEVPPPLIPPQGEQTSRLLADEQVEVPPPFNPEEEENNEVEVPPPLIPPQQEQTGRLLADEQVEVPPPLNPEEENNQVEVPPPLNPNEQEQEDPIVGAYQTITQLDLQNDPQGLAALELGVEFCVAAGVHHQILPHLGNWTVSEYSSIEMQIVNGINWKFNVTVADDDGHSFDANFIIYSDFSVGLVQIESGEWTYAAQTDPETHSEFTGTFTLKQDANGDNYIEEEFSAIA